MGCREGKVRLARVEAFIYSLRARGVFILRSLVRLDRASSKAEFTQA